MAIAGIYNTFWNAVEGARSLPDQGLGWLHRNAYWVLASSGAATAACVDSESSFPIKNPVVLAAATLPVIALSLTRDRAFRSAIEQNDAATVRAMLDTGYSPTKQYADGNTPLHLAIRKGQTEIAQALIEKLSVEDIKALSIQDNSGYTPLHRAIEKGQTEVALALIERLAVKKIERFFIKNNNGDTALHMAIEKGQTEIAQALMIPKFPFKRRSIKCSKSIPKEILPQVLGSPNRSGLFPIQLAIDTGREEIYRTFPEDVTVLRGDPGSLVDLLARKLGVGVIPKDHPWNQPLI